MKTSIADKSARKTYLVPNCFRNYAKLGIWSPKFFFNLLEKRVFY